MQSKEHHWDNGSRLPRAIGSQLPEDCIVFPGLVNAHDHLEFNLFPPLIDRVYKDYLDWGQDIHMRHKEIIQKIERISLDERVRFGLLKNLVNGVTRVVHHGPHHHRQQSLAGYPVYMNYLYADAPGTDPRWKVKLNWPFAGDIMIHVGEGTSAWADLEIDRLIKWNRLDKPVIGIHAIGLTPRQARQFKAIIWCPDSNIRLYNKTLPINTIRDQVTVLFGTDSTVSSKASIWDQLRTARQLNYISDRQLFKMVTSDALSFFYGEGQPEDWVVARRRSNSHWDAFYHLQPEDILLVLIKGQVWLCDDSLPPSLRPLQAVRISVGGVAKWVVRELGELVSLLDRYDIELPLGIQSAQQ